jgi:hypothetical protein
MIDYILSRPINGWFVLSLYWLPVFAGLVVLLRESVENYRHDLAHRSDTFYCPHLTVGWILGQLGVTLLPIFNLWRMLVDFLPGLLEWFSTALRYPLVSPKPRKS